VTSQRKSAHGNDSEFSKNYKTFLKNSALNMMVTESRRSDNNSSRYSFDNPLSDTSLFPDNHSLRQVTRQELPGLDDRSFFDSDTKLDEKD